MEAGGLKTGMQDMHGEGNRKVGEWDREGGGG